MTDSIRPDREANLVTQMTQALSDAGAFCGECGFEPGDKGCADCRRHWEHCIKKLLPVVRDVVAVEVKDSSDDHDAAYRLLAKGFNERGTELDRLRVELAEYEVMNPQQCPAGKHAAWLVDSEYAHKCPWCEIDRLREEAHLFTVAMAQRDAYAADVVRRALEEAADIADGHGRSITGGETGHLARSVAAGIAASLRARAATVTSPAREQDEAHGMACSNCETPVGWINCPTGGWWAHRQHPDDGHDASPMPASALEDQQTA